VIKSKGSDQESIVLKKNILRRVNFQIFEPVLLALLFALRSIADMRDLLLIKVDTKYQRGTIWSKQI